MVTVERTKDSIIFTVPATLGEQAVKEIKNYISTLESNVDSRLTGAGSELHLDEGLDEDGFVTDPEVLAISQEINHAGVSKLKGRLMDHPEFKSLLKEEE